MMGKGIWWAVRHYVPLPRASGCFMAPPPSLPSPATAALPGAFPTCSQPSAEFSDLPQEVLRSFCSTQSRSRITYWPGSRLSVGRTRVTFREGCWITQVIGYSWRILEWAWVKLLMTVTVWLLNFMWYSLGFCCRMLGRCQVIFGAGFPVAEQLIPTIFSEPSALSGLGISLVSTLGSEMAVNNKVTKSISFCPHLRKEHLYLQLSWRTSLLSNLTSPLPKAQQWQINMKEIRQQSGREELDKRKGKRVEASVSILLLAAASQLRSGDYGWVKSRR